MGPLKVVPSSFLLLLLLGLGLDPSSAECPSQDNSQFYLPTMYTEDETLYTCARVYKGLGDPEPIRGCNRCEGDDFDFYDVPEVCEKSFLMHERLFTRELFIIFLKK